MASPTGRSLLNILIWVLQLLLSAAFLLASYEWFVGEPGAVRFFDHIGFGQWFRYFTALVELGGALMLLWPRSSALGALVLAITMLCGICVHLFITGGEILVAAMLCTLSLVVLWFRRELLPSWKRPTVTA